MSGVVRSRGSDVGQYRRGTSLKVEGTVDAAETVHVDSVCFCTPDNQPGHRPRLQFACGLIGPTMYAFRKQVRRAESTSTLAGVGERSRGDNARTFLGWHRSSVQ